MNDIKEKITKVIEDNWIHDDQNAVKEFIVNELMRIFISSMVSSQNKFREGSD